jgi:predicted N-acetyltransferase YhbS
MNAQIAKPDRPELLVPEEATTWKAVLPRMPIDESRISVRPARREDVASIVRVSRTSITDSEDAGFGTPVTTTPQEEVEKLLSTWVEPNRVGSEEMLVAEVDGIVVGCVKIEERGESLELVDIDVSREMQGQGIGKCLVRFVEQRARERGKRAVTLGTSRNAAGVPWKSLPWWQARGYQITHEEENDWTRSIGPGVREIRMRKDIT